MTTIEQQLKTLLKQERECLVQFLLLLGEFDAEKQPDLYNALVIRVGHHPLAAADGYRDRRVVMDGNEIHERAGAFDRSFQVGDINDAIHRDV